MQVKAGGPPLAGVRVLDFTRVIAGPYLTATLADLGCEVIKVENPQHGDDSRAITSPGRDGQAAIFIGLNRSKRSLVLDLQKEEARQIVRRLVRDCDILVENFRPGTMEKLGLGPDLLMQENPRLIYCALSGYGVESPLHPLPGYDPIIQAETGYMYMTGDSSMPPIRSGGSVIDIMMGMNGTIAVLAALQARAQTGQGQVVGSSLQQTAIGALGYMLHGPILTGEEPQRLGNSSFYVAPNGLYDCADGRIVISAGNDKLFVQLARALGEEGLASDPRFSRNAARLANVAVLEERINAILGTASRDHWIERMRSFGVPAGSVRAPTEVLAAPEVIRSGMFHEVDHPILGRFDTIGSPLHLSGTPASAPRPAPLLDADTDALLERLLGLDTAEIARLRETGAIGRHAR